jgi:hypothetical protein
MTEPSTVASRPTWMEVQLSGSSTQAWAVGLRGACGFSADTKEKMASRTTERTSPRPIVLWNRAFFNVASSLRFSGM